MDQNNTIKIERYYSLIEDRVKINAWRNLELFQVDLCTDWEKKELEKYIAIEICIEGAKGDRDRFDLVFEEFYKILQVVIRRIKKPTYLFASSFKPDTRSPLRSYKGLLPKNIKNFSIEIEVEVDKKLSAFGALIEINEESFSKIREADFFIDSQSSFILISSRQSVFSVKSVEDIVGNYMKQGSRSHINYIKLIIAYCADKDILIRMGGDGGDEYVSFQIFLCRENERLVLNSLSALHNYEVSDVLKRPSQD